MLRASEVLYRFFTLASLVSLALSLWAAPYFGQAPKQDLLLGLGLYNTIGVCPGLVFLQFVTGFYLAVNNDGKPIRWKLLVLGSLLAIAVFWLNLIFGAGPFMDSWD